MLLRFDSTRYSLLICPYNAARNRKFLDSFLKFLGYLLAPTGLFIAVVKVWRDAVKIREGELKIRELKEQLSERQEERKKRILKPTPEEVKKYGRKFRDLRLPVILLICASVGILSAFHHRQVLDALAAVLRREDNSDGVSLFVVDSHGMLVTDFYVRSADGRMRFPSDDGVVELPKSDRGSQVSIHSSSNNALISVTNVPYSRPCIIVIPKKD
jgi:hypothetical protein